jgi:hypothetical protein
LSKYGVDYYGTAYYGANTNVQFSAANFIATPTTYGEITLTWGTPVGLWDFIRLVRNPYGYPISPDDGDLLFEQQNPGVTSYIDVGEGVSLTPGNIYYYTLFVRETVHNTWQSAGTARGISVKDYGTAQIMMDYLPTILKSNIPYDTSLEVTNTFLFRFLKLFAFQLDLNKTQAENVSKRFNVESIDGLLVPTFMEEFGVIYEPYIGLKQSRIFLRNISHLYQSKGSLEGVKEFIKAYAGYDNTIILGKNLMLDQNDSSFEQSIGSWSSITNATLARHLATDSPTIVPYVESAGQADFPNLQNATLQVTAVSSGNVVIGLTGDSPMHYGIPVTSFTNYTFTAYTQAGTTSRSVSANILWYDAKGKALTPSSFGSGTTNATHSWSRLTVTAASPQGAAYAVPNIKVTSAASGESHYFDALQFEQYSSATYFQDARQIEITLIASRINEITNPNFESNTNGWTFDNANAQLSTQEIGPDPDAPSVNLSGGSVEVNPIAVGLVTVATVSTPVFANNDYSFSIYAYSSEGSYSVTPFISWYDTTGALLSTEHGTAFTSPFFWQRLSITSIAPDLATSAVAGVTWTATSALDGIYFDAALFEKSAFVNSYFDGNNGVAELADLFWEGTANASRSHYYRNRYSIERRLMAKLPDWITYGSTFELLLAQPNT